MSLWPLIGGSPKKEVGLMCHCFCQREAEGERQRAKEDKCREGSPSIGMPVYLIYFRHDFSALLNRLNSGGVIVFVSACALKHQSAC